MSTAACTLWQREMVRFFRQPSRVIGAIGSPALFWLLLGSGFGQSFKPAASPLINGYLEYFYPGTLALIVLFTAIFSTVSIIEDRHEGFLQGVLAAPVPRVDIVTGKLLGSGVAGYHAGHDLSRGGAVCGAAARLRRSCCRPLACWWCSRSR